METLNASDSSIAIPVYPGDAAEAVEITGADVAQRQEAQEHSWRVLGVLSALMGFASISTDLYLPAMPEMERSLRAESGMVEWTVSGYLIGFSIGQLLWGPIADRYGRRLPVAIGIILFVIGSAGCALSETASVMIAWRVVQAVGACASVVLSRAMVRDLYEGDRANQMMSTLMTVMAVAPLIGPLVGGQILAVAGWRAIFWTLVILGSLTLFALTTFPETLPAHRRSHEPLGRAWGHYFQLLKQRKILAYAGAGGFFYAAMFAYLTGTPFAYIDYYHVPPEYYGFLFGLGILGIMATNMINVRLVPRFGGTALVRFGTGTAAIAGVVLAIDARWGIGGLAGLVIPLFVYVSVTGFVVANTIAGSLRDFPQRAGSVSALVGSIHYGSGIFGSALVGAFANGTPLPFAFVIAVCCIGSFLCALALPVQRVS